MDTVVLASEGDLVDASRILTAYFEAIGLPSASRDGPEDILAYLNEPAGMWLARHVGQVVGVIAIRPLTSVAGACEIKRLYVDPDYRSRGIADALLDAAEAAAVARGYTAAYLDTRADLHAAIAFYHRRGYEACERYNDNLDATNFMRRCFPVAGPASCEWCRGAKSAGECCACKRRVRALTVILTGMVRTHFSSAALAATGEVPGRLFERRDNSR